MEYLSPIIDGCRAALNVDVERALNLYEISDSDFVDFVDSTTQSFSSLAICFKTNDSNESCSFSFKHGKAKVDDDCLEPDVEVISDSSTILDVLDIDSRVLPTDVLGSRIQVKGDDIQDIVETLGLLCFPSLLRMARSGIDPTSLLAEDADAVIMAAASDLVIKLVKKWISLQLEFDSVKDL